MAATVAETICAIRDNVANRIGVSRFRTWFGDSADFQFDGQRLRVTVTNRFAVSWINTNHLEDLRAGAAEVLGPDTQISILVAVAAPAGEAPSPGPAGEVAVSAPAAPGLPPPRPARPERPQLRGELESYVVGPSNEVAFSVATAIARAPGRSFKHLLVHSGTGLGKTHLLQAMCNAVDRWHPELEWRFISGEEFTNEFIYAVKSGRVDGFRARFRNVDLLAVDDIHFLADKKATQEEFLHTFNAIDTCGKTVVFSSDRHPRNIALLSEPLLNRLLATTIVVIDPPDAAMRLEILRRRVTTMPCELPEDVLAYVARRVTGNVRELEGALYKIAAYSGLMREPLTLELARKILAESAPDGQPPTAATIERAVAAHFGVTCEALHSASRDRTVTQARAVAMFLIRRHTRMSFPEIGRLMGNKQHSTVLMAVRRVQQSIDASQALEWRTPAGPRLAPAQQVIEELEERLSLRRDCA